MGFRQSGCTVRGCSRSFFYALLRSDSSSASSCSLTRLTPIQITSVREVCIRLEHSSINCNSSSLIRNCMLLSRFAGPFGGLPVLGDIVIHLTFAMALLYIMQWQKSRGFSKNFLGASGACTRADRVVRPYEGAVEKILRCAQNDTVKAITQQVTKNTTKTIKGGINYRAERLSTRDNVAEYHRAYYEAKKIRIAEKRKKEGYISS